MVALFLGWTKGRKSKEKERGQKKDGAEGGIRVYLYIRAVSQWRALAVSFREASTKFHRGVELQPLNSVFSSTKVEGHLILLSVLGLQM